MMRKILGKLFKKNPVDIPKRENYIYLISLVLIGLWEKMGFSFSNNPPFMINPQEEGAGLRKPVPFYFINKGELWPDR